jgi:hypothetical protein
MEPMTPETAEAVERLGVLGTLLQIYVYPGMIVPDRPGPPSPLDTRPGAQLPATGHLKLEWVGQQIASCLQKKMDAELLGYRKTMENEVAYARAELGLRFAETRRAVVALAAFPAAEFEAKLAPVSLFVRTCVALTPGGVTRAAFVGEQGSERIIRETELLEKATEWGVDASLLPQQQWLYPNEATVLAPYAKDLAKSQQPGVPGTTILDRKRQAMQQFNFRGQPVGMQTVCIVADVINSLGMEGFLLMIEAALAKGAAQSPAQVQETSATIHGRTAFRHPFIADRATEFGRQVAIEVRNPRHRRAACVIMWAAARQMLNRGPGGGNTRHDLTYLYGVWNESVRIYLPAPEPLREEYGLPVVTPLRVDSRILSLQQQQQQQQRNLRRSMPRGPPRRGIHIF